MTKKVNISISEKMIEEYQKIADDLGISRSAAMVMGMKTYLDQQKSLQVGDIYKALEELSSMVKGSCK